jgi:hypothetical protein
LVRIGPVLRQATYALRLSIAQLKVNLLPLWKATIEVLTVLTGRCGEDLWPIVLSEIQNVLSPSRSEIPSPKWFLESFTQGQDISEQEKTWRNPGLKGALSAFDAIKDTFQRDKLVKVSRFPTFKDCWS